jgi:hypothetical protein
LFSSVYGWVSKGAGIPEPERTEIPEPNGINTGVRGKKTGASRKNYRIQTENIPEPNRKECYVKHLVSSFSRNRQSLLCFTSFAFNCNITTTTTSYYWSADVTTVF